MSDAKRRARPVKAPAVLDALGVDQLPDPPGTDELVRLLGVKARAGNVPAMKLLLERPWEKKNSDGDNDSSEDTDPLAGVDELAQRRAQAA